jgi:hypothetical protein
MSLPMSFGRLEGLGHTGNGQRQRDQRPDRPKLADSLVATAEILGQDPKGRRKLGPIGKAIANAWQEKAQRVHQYRVLRGSGQLAPRNTAVPIEPSIKVTDAFGRGVGAIDVRFDVVGGGHVQDERDRTGNNGEATCGTWTLGLAPGSQSIEVWIAGERVASLHAVAY